MKKPISQHSQKMRSPWNYMQQRMPVAMLLLLLGAAAWIVVIAQASQGHGAMGMSMMAFLIMWTLMMAAMMVPSVAPLASRYARMIRPGAYFDLLSFVVGYILVWATTGVVAYMLRWGVVTVAMESRTAATGAAVATYMVCGLYQFTPLKHTCLSQCRAPFSLLLQYASWRGTLRRLRVGLHHGLYCVGCCWALMSLLTLFGMMNIPAMLMLTIVITIEKLWTYSPHVSRVVGVACFMLAVAVMWFPALAPGLIVPTTMDMTK